MRMERTIDPTIMEEWKTEELRRYHHSYVPFFCLAIDYNRLQSITIDYNHFLWNGP